MNILISLFLVAACVLSPFAEAKHPHSAPEANTVHLLSSAAPMERIKTITFKQLMGREAINLNGLKSSETVTLGESSDALVTSAILHLNFTFSPALLPVDSHLKILINDQIVRVLPATKDNLGTTISESMEIDPRLLSNLTNIQFQFVGHYSHDCEDPFYTSLWMEIAGNSYFELKLQTLKLKNDLALLPEPFFNPRDFSSKLSIPFVFSAAPSRDTLNAAGIVSSWFGKLGAWRGARFPTNLDSLPAGHAVIFISNDDRPSFFKDYPKITGPSLEMMTNPVDKHSKLLLILGRDGADQKVAAQTLVLGVGGLSGSRASIQNIKSELPRKPYDAPNWVRMDRPMRFGELIGSQQELQASGYSPQPLHFSLRIPPDLFTWRSRGVPIDLKYRYTPPLTVSESRLRMSINDEMVKTINLLPSGEVEKNRIRLPLIDDMVFGQSHEVLLPSFKLGARNEVQFHFTSPATRTGACGGDFVSENVRSMIDADSKIDFSGFSHYTEMPNLNFFATSGFPFTKYADLSHTVVVIPEHPSLYDIETMLALLGRMSESTGYPSTQFRVAYASEGNRLGNADLLVIGDALKQGQLKQWADKLPVLLRDDSLRNSQPKQRASFLFNWFSFETKPDSDVQSEQQLTQNGSLTALLGFESPFSSKRSVVAVISSQPEKLSLSLDALERSTGEIQGSVVYIHPNKIESSLVGGTYFVGELPFWVAIWYAFANHPVMLAFLGVLAVLVFAFALWRTLRVIAAKRLRTEK